jgi:hypothetical protein
VRHAVSALNGEFHCDQETEYDRNAERLLFWSFVKSARRSPKAKSKTARLQALAERMHMSGRTTAQGWLDAWKKDKNGKQVLLGLTDEALHVILRSMGTEASHDPGID